MLLTAVRLYPQVPLLCRGFWRFSGTVVSLAAGRRQAPAAVHESFVFLCDTIFQTRQLLFYFISMQVILYRPRRLVHS
jgi:hypothetical protein